MEDIKMAKKDENEVTVLEKVVKVEETPENVFTLNKPINFDGEQVTALTLDFEKLTGADLEKAEVQFTAESPQNSLVMVKEMAKGYSAIVAANAAGVPVDLIRKLSAPDYAKITTQTTVFLMSGK